MKKTKLFYIWFSAKHNNGICVVEYTGEFKSMKIAQAYADMAISKGLVTDDFGNKCTLSLVIDEKTYIKENRRSLLKKELVD